MNHLTDEQLNAYLDGAFKGRDAEEAGRHLATCQPCSEALAELAAQDESLKPALAHDPGEAYFERFAARVEQRISAPETSRARPRAAFDLGRWFGSPRALAWAGGVAVVVVGGGLALMTSRDGVPPGFRDRDLATRLERSAPSETKQAPSREAQQEPPPALPSVDDAGQAAPLADAGPTGQEGSGVEPGVSPRATEREGVAAAGSADERLTAGSTMAKDQATPSVERNRAFAAPPGDTKVRGDALAPGASPPPAPAGARQASPGRAHEVRRNEAGEEVPVRGEVARRAVPAPSPATPSGADQATQVRKKLVAEPLDAMKSAVPQQKSSAPTQRIGATGAREESAARATSFAPPPPGPAAMSTFKQAAPARVAEGETHVCGDVRDAADRPIVGAQVVLIDIGRGVTTDATGRFCISAPTGEHPLSVMAVGYAESRQSVRAESGGTDVRVRLAAVSVLEEKGLSNAGRAPTTRRRAAPSTGTLGQPAAEVPVEPEDGFSALPDTLRRFAREAQRIEADAAARRSAALYDLAAGTWERALRRLANGPLEIETRRHLAASRYRAYEIAPNSRRARAAVEALTAYATRAPAGPDRDQAARWLDRVRP